MKADVKSGVVTVVERETYTAHELALDSYDLEYLNWFSRINQLDILNVFIRTGQVWVRFTRYVGTVSLPHNRKLEILPKIFNGSVDDIRHSFNRLLVHLGLLPSNLWSSAQISPGDLFLYHFIYNVMTDILSTIQRNPPIGHVRVRSVSAYLKGKWEPGADFKNANIFRSRFTCSSDVLDENVIVTQYIKSAVYILNNRFPTHVEPRLYRRIMEKLQGVEGFELTERSVYSINFRQGHGEYRDLCFRLHMLIYGEIPGIFYGRSAYGWDTLFNMESIFRSYVAHTLRKPNVIVVEEGPKKAFSADEAGAVINTVRPDISVIDKKNMHADPITSIYECKWKRINSVGDIDTSDLRQIWVYRELYQCKDVVLAYPAYDRIAGSSATLYVKHPSEDAAVRVCWVSLEVP